MEDVENLSEAIQSRKRSLDVGQVAKAHFPQPNQPEDSAAIEAEKVGRIRVNGANSSHHGALHSEEPASKKLKLDNGEQEAQSNMVDTRDKVKGVALVKQE